MRVEYAPPGTDPTRLPTKRNEVGVVAILKNNALLFAAVVIFILIGVAGRGCGSKKPPTPAPVPAVTATPAPVPASPLPIGCPGPLLGYEDVIVKGRFYEPGIWVVGVDQYGAIRVRCDEIDGTWLYLGKQAPAVQGAAPLGSSAGAEVDTKKPHEQ